MGSIPDSNCRRNAGEPVFDAYKIIETGSHKIGIVGVTTPETLSSEAPSIFADENGKRIYDFMQDDSGEKLYDAVQKAVDGARNEGADYVIVAGHIGMEAESHPWTYDDIISHVSGIDAFIDGHSHDTTQVVMKDKDGKEVQRTASGTKLESVGYVRISGETGEITSGLWNWQNDETAAELLGIENEAGKAVDKELAGIDSILDEEVGSTPFDLVINDPEAKDDEGHPVRIVRRAETNMADLCADAILSQTDADAAVINGGGVRADIKKGKITKGNIIDVFPFNNTICVAKLSGQQILDLLEWGVRSMPGENGEFMHVSNMTYEIHTYIESGCQEDAEGNFTGHTGDYRVQDLKGQTIDKSMIVPEPAYEKMLNTLYEMFEQ